MIKDFQIPEIKLGDNYDEKDKVRISDRLEAFRMAYLRALSDATDKMGKIQERANQFARTCSENKLPLLKGSCPRTVTNDDFVIKRKWEKLGEYDLWNQEEAKGWVCEYCGARDIASLWEDDGRGGSIYHYGCNCAGAKQSGSIRLLYATKD